MQNTLMQTLHPSPYHFVLFHLALNLDPRDSVHLLVQVYHWEQTSLLFEHALVSILFCSILLNIPLLKLSFLYVIEYVEILFVLIELFYAEVVVEIFVCVASDYEVHELFSILLFNVVSLDQFAIMSLLMRIYPLLGPLFYWC